VILVVLISKKVK